MALLPAMIIVGSLLFLRLNTSNVIKPALDELAAVNIGDRPFDHRGSFVTKMFGWHGDLTTEQTADIAGAKKVIYDGFKSAVTAGVPKERAGILVDEQFGAAILRDAAANGFVTACPAEKSGQDEFDFQFGDDFAKHIELYV